MIAGAAATVTVIGAVVGGLFAFEPWVERVEAASEANMVLPLPEQESIVVLPFDNLSGDTAQDYLPAGLTAAIISHLATWPHLTVIDRQTILVETENGFIEYDI